MKTELIDRLLRIRNKLIYGIYLINAGLTELGTAFEELIELIPSKPIRKHLQDLQNSEISLGDQHLDDEIARVLVLYEDEKAEERPESYP